MLKRLLSVLIMLAILSTSVTQASVGNGNFTEIGKINYKGEGGTHTEGVAIFLSKRVTDHEYALNGKWSVDYLDEDKLSKKGIAEVLQTLHSKTTFLPHSSEPLFVFDVKPGHADLPQPRGGRFISGVEANDIEWYKRGSGILTRDDHSDWDIPWTKACLRRIEALYGKDFTLTDILKFLKKIQPAFELEMSDFRHRYEANSKAIAVALSKGINNYTKELNKRAKGLFQLYTKNKEFQKIFEYLAFVETSLAVLTNTTWAKMKAAGLELAPLLCDPSEMKKSPIGIVVEPAIYGSVEYYNKGRWYAPVMVQDLYRLGKNLNPYTHILEIDKPKEFSLWQHSEIGHLAAMAQNVFNAVNDSVGQSIRHQVRRSTDYGERWTYGYMFPTMIAGIKTNLGNATHNLTTMDVTLNKPFPVDNPVYVAGEKIGSDVYVGIDIAPNANISQEIVTAADVNHVYAKVELTREAHAEKADATKPYTPSKVSPSKKLSYLAPEGDIYSELFCATSLPNPVQIANAGGMTFALERQGDWFKIPTNKLDAFLSRGSYWEKDLLKFIDKTAKTTISPNEKLTYTYKSKVTLTYLKKGKAFNPAELGSFNSPNVVTKYVGPNEKGNAPEEKTVSVSFIRGEKPLAPPANEEWSWSSKPDFTAYSEIKHHHPRQEQFEAMAGVPTGERMYYAIGGIPYVVEAEFKYHPKKQATREYHSYFTAVNSLYFDSDKATSVQVKKPSPAASGSLSGNIANAHTGGTWTVTWTGTIPNKGKDGPSGAAPKGGTFTSTATNSYDFSKFEAAVAALDKFAAEVKSMNASTSFTAPSDGKTRKIDDSDWTINSNKDRPTEPPADTQTSTGTSDQYDSEGKLTSAGQPGQTVQAKKSPDLNYTISVTVTLKPKSIDGPESEHILPQVNDRWKSTIEFDYIEIKNARVWRLDSGTVTGGEVNKVFGKPVKASIKKEHMLEFINIAGENNAENSRLRYTASDYTAGHPNYTTHVKASPWLDKVVWNEGPRSNVPSGAVVEKGTTDQQNGRTNHDTSAWLKQSPSYRGYPNAKGIKYNNNNGTFANRSTFNAADALDKATAEWKKFEQRRNTKITPTLISDFIVLHTDEGDIPIFYFQKSGVARNADDENYGYITASKEEQWDKNTFGSIAVRYKENEWSPEEVGYNGQFETPNQKFSVLKEDKEFDYSILLKDKDSGEEAKKSTKTIKQYVRPTQSVNSTSDEIVTQLVENGEYVLSNSKVNWKFLDIKSTTGSSKNNSKVITALVSSDVTDVGRYSDGHEDVNNIIIHDPSSTKYAMIPIKIKYRHGQKKKWHLPIIPA